MKQGRIVLAGAAAALGAVALIAANTRDDAAAREPGTPVPVLSVTVVRAETATLPIRVPATGNVAAWQEAIVGAEGDALRLVDVKADVGDIVERGQVLALFNADIVDAEVAAARAAVAQIDAEVDAEVDEADANTARAEPRAYRRDVRAADQSIRRRCGGGARGARRRDEDARSAAADAATARAGDVVSRLGDGWR